MSDVPEDKDMAPTGQPISFFSILKSLASQMSLGTDITRITLPSIFSYPLSLLEIMAKKRMRGMEIFDQINAAEDPIVRLLLIMRWFYCGLTQDEFGKKPLNPILGESFECTMGGKCHYIAEQVSHHPPISAFYFEHVSTGISYYGHVHLVAKFGGNSVGAEFGGASFIYVPKYQELYQFSFPMPTLYARGLLIGKSRNELGGDMWISCDKSNLQATFSFKTMGMFSGTDGDTSGKVSYIDDKKSKPIVSWSGVWFDEIELTVKSKDWNLPSDLFKSGILFRASDVSPPQLEHYVRPDAVDSRSVWGPTMEAIRAGDLAKADEEKGKIETAQRAKRADTEAEAFKPKHFTLNEESGLWTLNESSKPSVFIATQPDIGKGLRPSMSVINVSTAASASSSSSASTPADNAESS